MRYSFKSVARDGAGNIVTSATVNIYLAGTTTAASVYEAYTGGTAVSSVTTGTDGVFEFYIDDTDYAGTQQFKIVISKSNYSSITRDYLTIFDINAMLDTDGTLAADSDDLVPTQKAAKTYVDAKVSDTAYSSSWGGIGDIAPSKNAVYNQIEAIVLGSAIVSDAAYSSDWDNEVSTSPSKNATYDKLEAMTAEYGALVSNTAYGAGWDSVDTIAPSKNAVYDALAPKASPTFTGTVASNILTSTNPLFSAVVAATVSNCTGVNSSLINYALKSNSSPACNWTEITDRATNCSGGTFTAPVTGNYLFTGCCNLEGLTNNTSGTIGYVITSNRTYIAFNINSLHTQAVGRIGYPFSVIADMDAADTAYLQIFVYDGTNAKTVDISINTRFQGYLLP